MITKVDQCMHLKRQEIGFFIDRQPLKVNVFLHFINPISLVYNGKLVKLSANCCYIGTCGTPLYYTAEHISMLHNFVHFKITDISKLEELGLPLNTPFYTNMQDDITKTIEQIEYTLGANAAYSNQIMKPELMFEELLSRLAFEKQKDVGVGGYDRERNFDNLRTQIYIDPSEWNVEKMSDYVHLTRSHFSIKYKQMFGVSPNTDINMASMLVAGKLLSTTSLTVKDISSSLGYKSTTYFIKLFKSHYGTTPDAYRKNNLLT